MQTHKVYGSVDWFHNNAVVYHEGDIIISGRHQSSVVRLSWPQGEIKWILADHRGWTPMLRKYLLAPAGEGFEWSYSQHASRVLPDLDNNPDTIDILLFDNGNARHEGVVEGGMYSRMVHYRVNEKEMTAEQIWQYGKEEGLLLYALYASSVDYLPNGNRLGAFDRTVAGDHDINSSFIEADAAGRIVWEAYATSDDKRGSFHAYRIERNPLYTQAANDLRIGVPARNLIPEEMLP